MHITSTAYYLTHTPTAYAHSIAAKRSLEQPKKRETHNGLEEEWERDDTLSHELISIIALATDTNGYTRSNLIRQRELQRAKPRW